MTVCVFVWERVWVWIHVCMVLGPLLTLLPLLLLEFCIRISNEGRDGEGWGCACSFFHQLVYRACLWPPTLHLIAAGSLGRMRLSNSGTQCGVVQRTSLRIGHIWVITPDVPITTYGTLDNCLQYDLLSLYTLKQTNLNQTTGIRCGSWEYLLFSIVTRIKGVMLEKSHCTVSDTCYVFYKFSSILCPALPFMTDWN